MSYFSNINKIQYEGLNTENPLAYRYYDANKMVFGKTMRDHLRLAVCAWHNFCWEGNDAFGGPVFDRLWLVTQDPMARGTAKVKALFELTEKLDLPFITFHDRDLAPEGKTLQESNDNLKKIAEVIASEMQRTNIGLLWGTANLFSHKRYLAGAATNPDPAVFAYAIGQVKAALDVTKELGGENYVFWGGREGYDFLLNTDLKKEQDQMARFFDIMINYKHKIGFKGPFLIEPKPCEPTKHQYDYDVATVAGFLKKHGFDQEIKTNIEANHATLAGHSFEHEVATAIAEGVFGSIDANRGDPQLGWDTDQFPMVLNTLVRVMYLIVKNGGFTTGGFNFDAKLRRQSIDLEDLFLGHISGIDALAHALLITADLIENDVLEKNLTQRYQQWDDEKFAQDIMAGKMDAEQISQFVMDNNLDPKPVSARQEYWEHVFGNFIK